MKVLLQRRYLHEFLIFAFVKAVQRYGGSRNHSEPVRQPRSCGRLVKRQVRIPNLSGVIGPRSSHQPKAEMLAQERSFLL